MGYSYKKGTSIVDAFKKIISQEINPKKIWVDQGSEFYNNTFKKFLKMNNIEIYSTYNEGKSFVAERFIRTLKNKIFKHLTTISKNVYIDVLNDIVPWNYTISDLNGEKVIGTFHEKELQKTNQKEFRIEKILKRKGDKLYVKWKGYDNSFNKWINKKDIV